MIESVVIRIDNFDNDAMQNDERGEVVSILQNMINNIQCEGLVDLDGTRLLDSNGNAIGNITVNPIDEDDIDDEGEDAW